MRNYALTLALVLAATACGPGAGPQPITITQEAASPHANPDATTRERFGMTQAALAKMQGGDAAAAPQAQLFQWDMPEGWDELPASSMRLVNLSVGLDYSDHGTECYVSVLQGDGGGVDANINRWRAQMGLQPISSDEVVALPTIKFLNRDALYLDIEGTYTGMQGSANIENARMLAVLFIAQGRAVTVKMAGPADVIAREKDHFEQFVTSLRPAPQPGMAQSDSAAAPAAAASNAPYSWSAPEGWTAGPDNPMRITTFFAGPDNAIEIAVSQFPGDVGGLEANVNRWRGQVGADSLDAAAIAALPTITMLGQPSPIVDAEGHYTGMGNASVADGMLLGAICTLPENTLFIKMTGPADLVKKERDNFVAFCESFKQ